MHTYTIYKTQSAYITLPVSPVVPCINPTLSISGFSKVPKVLTKISKLLPSLTAALVPTNPATTVVQVKLIHIYNYNGAIN